jgi:CRP-like cAMP-binding protein
MSCTLRERLALTLLELCQEFGVKEERGTRLRVAARHRNLAELIGASRPRVTELVFQFECDKLLSHAGYGQLIILRDRLEGFLGS